MVKSGYHKFWKLDLLAKFSETILEEKERPIGTTVKSSSTPPEWLIKVMMKLEEENAHDPKLVIEKRLHASDLSKIQSRLSMPINQLLSSDFLTEEETTLLHKQTGELNDGPKESLNVVLVDPLLKRHEVELRRWKTGANWNYVVVGCWNKVIDCNKFEVDDVTVIWSFRYGGGKLCLALSPLVRDSKHSGQSSSRCS
ncbi:B3 domain-containing protein [Hirschfeldia incana]|nr:B3 domain-containing protein [Hirschfeldia incana]